MRKLLSRDELSKLFDQSRACAEKSKLLSEHSHELLEASRRINERAFEEARRACGLNPSDQDRRNKQPLTLARR